MVFILSGPCVCMYHELGRHFAWMCKLAQLMSETASKQGPTMPHWTGRKASGSACPGMAGCCFGEVLVQWMILFFERLCAMNEWWERERQMAAGSFYAVAILVHACTRRRQPMRDSLPAMTQSWCDIRDPRAISLSFSPIFLYLWWRKTCRFFIYLTKHVSQQKLL